ncbi:hypothetical protein STSP2_01775 [Anaerohalosphaera lusitana]|uniref:Uncharacterized protein n=1 Tax=Anaerohalosphaera lusitana TaxID=1936003 RepID=A0A1U9NLD1_9BACT|nr:hypothetical protein [Anaerohalosphaera lusitana]AQT68607.1 hypothetical protein STSP2_01775 [Anaerohalosphaera lusitana]
MDSVVNFIKKYRSFIIPACILVVALILFVPLSMVRGSLAEKLEESARMGSKVSQLINSAPSELQAQVEQAYQDQHAAEVKKVDTIATQSTKRDLVSARLRNYILPEPAEPNPRLFDKFAAAYLDELRSLLDSMNALDAPSESEIDAELAKMSPGSYSRRNYGGRSRNSRNADDSQEAIIDALCEERAASISVYAGPEAFRWYDYWDNFEFDGINNALDDCWYSEISNWVYRDIVDTIKTVNAGSNSVQQSDVKRLIGVSFSSYADYPKKRETKFSNDWPDYVVDYTPGIFGVTPWTARKCDDNIDVIQFSTAVLINSKAVPDFLNALCSEKDHTFSGFRGDQEEQTFEHNQITVLEYAQGAIDPDAEVHDNYRYGDSPVVRLDLVCEYIFYKKGYDEIKPKSIKDYLKKATEEKKQTYY